MCFLYDDMRIMYPQLVTAVHKAESEQEDWLGEVAWVRSAQSEGKDGIVSLREQITQQWVVVQRPQRTANSNPQQLGGVRNGNRNQHNTRGQGNNTKNDEDVTTMRSNVFDVRVGKYSLLVSKHPFNVNQREVVDASNLLPEMCKQVEGS